MIEVTLHALGRFKRSVTYRTTRPCAQDICHVARVVGGIYGGSLELELKAESRPDLGGGFFVHKARDAAKRHKPSRVVGLCIWREVDDDETCDMEAGA